MNKIVMRLNILKENKQIEVIFDERLSFIDNLILLKEIYYLTNIEDIHIWDNDNRMFLKRDVPLTDFHFPQFIRLYLL